MLSLDSNVLKVPHTKTKIFSNLVISVIISLHQRFPFIPLPAMWICVYKTGWNFFKELTKNFVVEWLFFLCVCIFQKLKNQSIKYRVDKTFPTKSAEKTENIKKNRYKDIVPCKSSSGRFCDNFGLVQTSLKYVGYVSLLLVIYIYNSLPTNFRTEHKSSYWKFNFAFCWLNKIDVFQGCIQRQLNQRNATIIILFSVIIC